ncbi:MAG: hypothetical protein ABIJ57_00105 [Pseudomonadota bacterium]
MIIQDDRIARPLGGAERGMMMEYDEMVSAIAEKIRVKAEPCDRNPHIMGGGANMDHWNVRLTRTDDKRRMSLIYSKGVGHKGEPPHAAELVETLLSDIGFNGDFEEFCAEFGCDNGSRSAYKTWKAVVSQNKKTERFMGDLISEIQED